MRALTRRSLLGGGVAVAGVAAAGGLVDAGVLPGQGHLRRLLGTAPGQHVDAAVPAVAPGPVLSASLDSQRFRRSVGYTLCYPPGTRPGDRLPVCLALPGRATTAAALVRGIGYDRWLAAGGGRFVLAAVDGGTSYWHPRAGGLDPLGMLTAELLPALAARGLRTDRIGAMGVSMGAYGALLLARQSARGALGGRTVAVAAAASAALWSSYSDVAPGAFDDEADWRTWGELTVAPGVASSTALWLSCGRDDPFAAADRAYRAATGQPAGGFGPGAHTDGYWRSVAAAQLAFVGAHLR